LLAQDMIYPLGNGAGSPPFFLRLTKELCKEEDDERTKTIR
jgi:hypothetical protein